MHPAWRVFRNRPERFVPALLYAALVFGVSVADPPSGGGFPTLFGLVGVDKVVHAGTYGVFVVLVAYALREYTLMTILLVVAIASAYGAGIELVQSVLPYRSFEYPDLLANALGALLAGTVLWVLSHRGDLWSVKRP